MCSTYTYIVSIKEVYVFIFFLRLLHKLFPPLFFLLQNLPILQNNLSIFSPYHMSVKYVWGWLMGKKKSYLQTGSKGRHTFWGHAGKKGCFFAMPWLSNNFDILWDGKGEKLCEGGGGRRRRLIWFQFPELGSINQSKCVRQIGKLKSLKNELWISPKIFV